MQKPAPFDEPQYVTRPFLPPLEEFQAGVAAIWANKQLTNNGPFEQKFSELLGAYLECGNLCTFSNGTMALQIAIQALGLKGEVVTTPFTFAATTHALHWNGITPVFCDIERDTFNIDPEQVEDLINPRTSAVLAVHVYGNPCRLDALAEICRRRKLALIYDAAHAFGVKVHGRSIAHYGDVSMFSFHATKHFNTFEGGLLTYAELGIGKAAQFLKNFGIVDETTVVMPGTNAKLSEVHSLMGILSLQHMHGLIDSRRRLAELYRERLRAIPGIEVQRDMEGVEHNHCYLPVLIDERAYGHGREYVYEALREFNIYSRRYFFPLVSDYPCYAPFARERALTVARHVSERVLCLPLHNELDPEAVHRICDALEWIRAGA